MTIDKSINLCMMKIDKSINDNCQFLIDLINLIDIPFTNDTIIPLPIP